MEPIAWAFIIVAYGAGTATGRWLYRRTLMGKVCIAFDNLLTDMRRAELKRLKGDQ